MHKNADDGHKQTQQRVNSPIHTHFDRRHFAREQDASRFVSRIWPQAQRECLSDLFENVEHARRVHKSPSKSNSDQVGLLGQ